LFLRDASASPFPKGILVMTILKMSQAALLTFAISLSACTTNGVINGVVDTTGFVAKTAVKGTVGAGKMVVRGVSGSDSDKP
jgi:hypothetical protein